MQKLMHRIPMQSKNNIEESQQPSFQQQLLPVLHPSLSGSRAGNFGFQSCEVEQGSGNECYGCSLPSLWLLDTCLLWEFVSGDEWLVLGGTASFCIPLLFWHCPCVLARCELGEAAQRVTDSLLCAGGEFIPQGDTSFAVDIRAELSCGNALTFPLLPELVCVVCTRL